MDNSTKKILYYEWISFKRNHFQRTILLITMLFGFYAIYYGHTKIQKQHQVIDKVLTLQGEEFERYRQNFDADLEQATGLQQFEVASDPSYAWHRHGYHATIPPTSLATLAIGQRDILPFYYRLTGMSLYYQLFQNEITNPVKLFVGNFDLAFVLVYLFPLLIISMIYGLYTNEKEHGTLNLLLIQQVPLRKILLIRLLFYFLIINILALSLSIIGFGIAGSLFQPDSYLLILLWFLAVLVYNAFWFSLLFLVVSIKKSSSITAITSAGFWLLFLIVIPAVLNSVSTLKYPLDTTELAGLTRRTSLENDDDENEVRAVILEYLPHTPWQNQSEIILNGENQLAKAYAAFTSLRDIENKHMVDHYYEQIENRTSWSSTYSWVNPSVNFQEVLTSIAFSDVHTFLSFQKDVEQFHSGLTHFYFERLFLGKSISIEDYDRLPQFELSSTMDDQLQSISKKTLQLLIIQVSLFIGAWVRLSSRET